MLFLYTKSTAFPYNKVTKKMKCNIIPPIIKRKLTRYYSLLVNMAKIAVNSYVDRTVNRYII